MFLSFLFGSFTLVNPHEDVEDELTERHIGSIFNIRVLDDVCEARHRLSVLDQQVPDVEPEIQDAVIVQDEVVEDLHQLQPEFAVSVIRWKVTDQLSVAFHLLEVDALAWEVVSFEVGSESV